VLDENRHYFSLSSEKQARSQIMPFMGYGKKNTNPYTESKASFHSKMLNSCGTATGGFLSIACFLKEGGYIQ